MKYIVLMLLTLMIVVGSASAEIIRVKSIIKVERHEKEVVNSAKNTPITSESNSGIQSKTLTPKEQREKLMLECIESNIDKLKQLNIDKKSGTYTELGDFYFNRAAERDIERAFLCYYLGAKNSEPYAFYLLGSYYETGYSHSTFYLRASTNIAVAFYERASELSVPGGKERAEMLLNTLPK